MKDSHQCKSCNCSFDIDEHVPIIIPCGHTYCETCCIKMISPQDSILVCPIDDKEFKLSPVDLVKNAYLYDILKE